MPSRKIEIVVATPAHASMLHDFFRSVWPSESSALRESGADDPRPSEAYRPEDALSIIAVESDRVIGYLGTLPLRLWDGRREQRGHWFKGFMVLPEFRNGPIGYGLVKEAVKHVPVGLVVTVQPASWRLFKAMGMSHLGALENRVRLLDSEHVLSAIDIGQLGLPGLPAAAVRGVKVLQRLGVAKLAGATANIGLAGWSLAFGSRSRGVKTGVSTGIDYREYDTLWANARTTLNFSEVRDGEYVQSRYARTDASPYTLFEARDGVDLVGFAALRSPSRAADPRLSGLTVAILSDLLVSALRTDAMFSLLASVEKAAREVGADALVCSASHPKLLGALGARGYLRIPSTLQFLSRLPDGSRGTASVRDWWLLRSDGNADEGF